MSDDTSDDTRTVQAAWERARDLFRSARPVVVAEEDQAWEEDAAATGGAADAAAKTFWKSTVPGSGAPDCLAFAAVQSLENQGFRVEGAEPIFDEGLAAIEADDMERLHVAHMRLWAALRAAWRAGRVEGVDRGPVYSEWSELEAAVSWPDDVRVPLDAHFAARVRAGWWGQVVGGAAGTAIEGYTAAQLAERFGDFTDYVRPPNTYNDDITYEIAFLEALKETGTALTSEAVAAKWAAMVPFAWSAEAVALTNLSRGHLPPESGRRDNPFDEWIGAQMRGAVCGLVAPGRAREAARLAWLDGCISHTSNGILGEVFNAVLTARAFVETDARTLLVSAVEMIPAETEYGGVLHRALAVCRASNDWREAWEVCDAELVQYHWIHAYPNAAAEVVALWFADGDFDETLRICCAAGHDVDCNAAQILCALAVMKGEGAIARRWIDPLGPDVMTYMRRPKRTSVDALTASTVAGARHLVR